MPGAGCKTLQVEGAGVAQIALAYFAGRLLFLRFFLFGLALEHEMLISNCYVGCKTYSRP